MKVVLGTRAALVSQGSFSVAPTSTMSAAFVPPPPGMPPPPPGMPPPPGFTQKVSSRMSPEVLAQKSQKWISMQKKRYGEKRKGGYVDMGKQVCAVLCVAAR